MKKLIKACIADELTGKQVVQLLAVLYGLSAIVLIVAHIINK